MEHQLGRNEMTMRKPFLAIVLMTGAVLAALGQQPGQLQAQPAVRFYNVDTENQIEGVIEQVLFEPRYENRAPFLIVILEEKKTSQKFRVEVSPVWFFNRDLHKGEPVKIIGSLYTKDDDAYIIARELKTGGETFKLRDSRGFPNWRGGPMKQKGKRQGRGM
jgi:hypothetical protein